MIEAEDLYIGARLICTKNCDFDEFKHTKGGVYEVFNINKDPRSKWPYRIECDVSSFIYSLDELNDDNRCPSFVPLSKALTSEELFLYEISGNLPERYND